MRLQLISIAQKPPAWANAACDEYLRRLPREMKPKLVALPLPSRRAKQPVARQRQRESDLILGQLGGGDFNLALDERGDLWSSRDWSLQLQHWMLEYPRVNLIIGGPDGLSRECLEACRQRVSLGRITLPHALVRIVLLEQLYRAWTILQGHPYHRD